MYVSIKMLSVERQMLTNFGLLFDAASNSERRQGGVPGRRLTGCKPVPLIRPHTSPYLLRP